MYYVKYANTVIFADYCINLINGLISRVCLMHYWDCGRISGSSSASCSCHNHTIQKYVQNKYKPGTNPCAELRYIVT